VPPETELVRVVVVVLQIVDAPDITATTGNGNTVWTLVATDVPHALVIEYVMVAVPSPTPVTEPAAPTVATVSLLLDQVPPVVAFVSELELPTHTDELPDIVPKTGIVLTVTIAVT
jgi:hypothetical protein